MSIKLDHKPVHLKSTYLWMRYFKEKSLSLSVKAAGHADFWSNTSVAKLVRLVSMSH